MRPRRRPLWLISLEARVHAPAILLTVHAVQLGYHGFVRSVANNPSITIPIASLVTQVSGMCW